MAKRAGSIADENEQFDTRALIRLSTWGIAAVVAVTTTIFAARSELGTKRVHAAVLSITASPADPPSAVLGQLMARTADVERESRRLSETVRSIGSERERLQVRVGMVERERGQVARSRDLASAVSLVAVTLALGWLGARMVGLVSTRIAASFTHLATDAHATITSTTLSGTAGTPNLVLPKDHQYQRYNVTESTYAHVDASQVPTLVQQQVPVYDRTAKAWVFSPAQQLDPRYVSGATSASPRQ